MFVQWKREHWIWNKKFKLLCLLFALKRFLNHQMVQIERQSREQRTDQDDWENNMQNTKRNVHFPSLSLSLCGYRMGSKRCNKWWSDDFSFSFVRLLLRQRIEWRFTVAYRSNAWKCVVGNFIVADSIVMRVQTVLCLTVGCRYRTLLFVIQYVPQRNLSRVMWIPSFHFMCERKSRQNIATFDFNHTTSGSDGTHDYTIWRLERFGYESKVFCGQLDRNIAVIVSHRCSQQWKFRRRKI